jgi:competence protein ComEC
MRWTSSDGVTLDVLAPSLPLLADTGDDVNENSIVVMLHYHGFSELFMGDAGEAIEARLLVSGADLQTNALKVGHHGSLYASTPAFAAAIHPQIAVISVGRHNTFGHPALRTIEAWHGNGANVRRTDQCGAITLPSGRPWRRCCDARPHGDVAASCDGVALMTTSTFRILPKWFCFPPLRLAEP